MGTVRTSIGGPWIRQIFKRSYLLTYRPFKRWLVEPIRALWRVNRVITRLPKPQPLRWTENRRFSRLFFFFQVTLGQFWPPLLICVFHPLVSEIGQRRSHLKLGQYLQFLLTLFTMQELQCWRLIMPFNCVSLFLRHMPFLFRHSKVLINPSLNLRGIEMFTIFMCLQHEAQTLFSRYLSPQFILLCR